MSRESPDPRVLEHLSSLPFVDEVRWQAKPSSADRADGMLAVKSGRRTWRFLVEQRSGNLTRLLVESLVARARDPHHPWLLVAPTISRPMSDLLIGAGWNFLDLAGNCRVALGNDHVAWIEGRPRLPVAQGGRSAGAATYRVLLALLVRPDLASASERALATAAGTSRTAAAGARRLLGDARILVRGASSARLDYLGLLEKFVSGYDHLLRPRLLAGRFSAGGTEQELIERRVETALGPDNTAWAWGGGAAAWRLTGHYRGPATVIHHADPPRELAATLRLLPTQRGEVTILRTPRVALDGPKPHVVHPALIYAELLVDGTERARQAAEEVRERHLEGTTRVV